MVAAPHSQTFTPRQPNSASVGDDNHSERGWTQDTYEQPAGDIVTLSLNLTVPSDSATDTVSSNAAERNDAYVQLGSVATGFIDVLHVVDSDDDGEVSFAINTRTLGTSDSLSATNTELVYHTSGDQVRSAVHGQLPDGESAPTFVGPDGGKLTDFNAYLEALGLIDGRMNDRGTDQLQQPLQPGAYPVVASAAGSFQINRTEQTPNTTDSSLMSEFSSTTLGETTITLTKPGIDAVSVQAAPAGPANGASNQTALAKMLTEQSSVTTADRVVITADATGIYGHLVAIEGGFDALTTGFSPSTLSQLETRTGEGVQFAVEAQEGGVVQGPGSTDGVQSPLEVLDFSAVDPSSVFVYANQSAGKLHVVINPRTTDGLSLNGLDERDFSTSLSYETDASEPFRFDREDRNIQTYYRGLLGGADGDVNKPAFPYLAPGERAHGTTPFTLLKAQARFASNRSTASAEQLLLERSENITIHGTTNLAPGTEATLQVKSTASNTPLSYIRESKVAVAANGTFTGTVDVSSSAIGDTVTVSLLANDVQIASTTAEIVAAQSPTETDLTTTAQTDSETKMDTTDESGGGVPGFTPITSLAAVGIVFLSLIVMYRTDR